MGLEFSLKDFSGPLDLLLHLIGNARIDIKDIFVSQVTEQYIRIVQYAELDMEEASEFVQMAATLLLIKSRSILPAPPADLEDEEENPEQALIRQLEDYARFQQLATQMQAFEEASARLFNKLPDEFPLPPPVYELEGLTLDGLMAAFAGLLSRLRGAEETLPERQAVIQREQHSVGDFVSLIARRVRRGSLPFTALLSEKPTRNEVVTLFLAMLELLKQGRLRVSQEGSRGEIVLSRGSRGEEKQLVQ